MGSYSVVKCHQAFDGPASLLFSCQCWRVVGEPGYGDASTPIVWLSNIALLPWLPSFFPTIISSLTSHWSVSPQSTATRPWDCSTVPTLQLPDTGPSRVSMDIANTVWFSFYLGCHRSAASVSALNVFSLTQTTAPCGNQTPASVLLPGEGRSTPTNTPVFPPSSFILSNFACVYILFLLVRYSSLLSAGVLHALLYLKVYSWCIRGERCIPCPPNPPPSCSFPVLFSFYKYSIYT